MSLHECAPRQNGPSLLEIAFSAARIGSLLRTTRMSFNFATFLFVHCEGQLHDCEISVADDSCPNCAAIFFFKKKTFLFDPSRRIHILGGPFFFFFFSFDFFFEEGDFFVFFYFSLFDFFAFLFLRFFCVLFKFSLFVFFAFFLFLKFYFFIVSFFFFTIFFDFVDFIIYFFFETYSHDAEGNMDESTSRRNRTRSACIVLIHSLLDVTRRTRCLWKYELSNE